MMKTYTEGEVLKALRELLQQRHKTQAEIAKELGFSQPYLSQVANAGRPVTTELAAALGFREQPRTFLKVR